LREINDPLAKDELKEAITHIFKYEQLIDKIEIITIIQGRFPRHWDLIQAFLISKHEKGYDELMNSSSTKIFFEAQKKTKILNKFDLEFARPILLDVVNLTVPVLEVREVPFKITSSGIPKYILVNSPFFLKIYRYIIVKQNYHRRCIYKY